MNQAISRDAPGGREEGAGWIVTAGNQRGKGWRAFIRTGEEQGPSVSLFILYHLPLSLPGVRHPPDGRQQVGIYLVLADELIRSGRQRRPPVGSRLDQAHGDEARLRHGLAKVGKDIDPGQAGHAQVQQDHLGPQALGLDQPLLAPLGGTHQNHLALAVFLQEPTQKVYEDEVIIHHQNRDRTHKKTPLRELD